jgi:hypothetical protein
LLSDQIFSGDSQMSGKERGGKARGENGRKWSPGKQSSLTTLRDHVTGAVSKHSTPSHTSILVTKHTSPARTHEDGQELARSLAKDLERLHKTSQDLELGKQSQAQGGEERDDRDEADNDILEMTKRLAGMGKALVEEDYMTRATLMKEFVHHTDQIIANRTSRKLQGLKPEQRKLQEIENRRERDQLKTDYTEDNLESSDSVKGL